MINYTIAGRRSPTSGRERDLVSACSSLESFEKHKDVGGTPKMAQISKFCKPWCTGHGFVNQVCGLSAGYNSCKVEW